MILASLAGCVSGEGGAPAASPSPSSTVAVAPPSETSAADETGSVEGVVTDEEAVPLAGADVLLRELTIQAKTDPNGSFAFTSVPPGKYSVIVALVGYVDEGKSVQVLAGEVSEVTFQLVRLAVVESYHTTHLWKGKMSCGAVLVPWCGIMDEANQDYGTPNPTEERWLFNWTYASSVVPAQVIFELVWTPTLPQTAQRFTILALTGFTGQSTGPSVLRLEVDGDQFDEVEEDPDEYFRVGVYPDIEPVVDQRFDFYRTDFYGTPAPEGWSVLNETA